MRAEMSILILSLMAGSVPTQALTMGASQALAELQAESGRTIVGSTAEGLKSGSGQGFTGEPVFPKAAPARAAEAPEDLTAGRDIKAPPSYHFVGSKPLDGVTIYTPKPDSPGQDSTTGGGAADDPGKLLKWATYGALGLGAAMAIGGIWSPPLLLVGGFFLGVGATLWVIGKLFGGK